MYIHSVTSWGSRTTHSAHMWLEQQHLGWKVRRSEIETKLSVSLLLPLATTDAVRLGGGEVEREPASSLVHTCTALHHDEKREERKLHHFASLQTKVVQVLDSQGFKLKVK